MPKPITTREPRILCIEDNGVARDLLRRQIQFGDISMASSSAEALGFLKSDAFDLVIADFLLGESDAFAIIDRVREQAGPLEIPIIVVSAALDPDRSWRLLRAGVNETRQKPVPTEEMRALVMRMLHDPYVSDEPRTAVSGKCYTWVQLGMHHIFSPDLAQTVTGRSYAEAEGRMRELLCDETAWVPGCAHSERMVDIPLWPLSGPQ